MLYQRLRRLPRALRQARPAGRARQRNACRHGAEEHRTTQDNRQGPRPPAGRLRRLGRLAMRLLVITQAVDRDDPVLGFFHRWLEALAPTVERLEVVCLREGRHDLPKNVSVHSLGKPASRFAYVLNLYRYIFSLRYDAVFVHMNEEYVLLGGILWRLMGTKVVLWRNHKMGSWRTRLAVSLSSVVCHTSREAFVAYSKKAILMPAGIDTDSFVPPDEPA